MTESRTCSGTATPAENCRRGSGIAWAAFRGHLLFPSAAPSAMDAGRTGRSSGSADFNQDGIDDLFWQNLSTGAVQMSLLNGSGVVTTTRALAKRCGPTDGCSTTWKAAGLVDINQDGIVDLLWQNMTTGELQGWLLNGTDRIQGLQSLSRVCDASSACTPGTIPVGICGRVLRRINPIGSPFSDCWAERVPQNVFGPVTRTARSLSSVDRKILARSYGESLSLASSFTAFSGTSTFSRNSLSTCCSKSATLAHVACTFPKTGLSTCPSSKLNPLIYSQVLGPKRTVRNI